MNGLDSPLESLAFIPVNLSPLFSAVVNNLWSWLALFIASFSFWRLRSSTLKTHILLPPPPPPTTQLSTTSFKGKCIAEEREKEGNEEDVEVLTRGNSKKFFTVYYDVVKNDEEFDDHDHDHDEEDDQHDEVDGEDEVEEDVINKWGCKESMVEMRGGDLGWYSYQNRKVIDGSVVRLWEDDIESGCCSPRSCRSRRPTVRC